MGTQDSGNKTWDITLIGTIHLFEESEEKLHSLLEELSPKVITVEISSFSVEFRRQRQDIWAKKLEKALSDLPKELLDCPKLELLRRQINTPYEWRVALEYSSQKGVRLLPIDVGDLSRYELPTWEHELLSRKNIEYISKNIDLKSVTEHFARLKREAEHLLEQKNSYPMALHPLSWLKDPFWTQREIKLARRLFRVLRVCKEVVHISGWMHLVEGSPWKTLIDHLREGGARIEVKMAF
ncbi:hypothetical protein DBT_0385 [Dissulfuribacter thermophilus]|uniref:TraB family protein n=1 Tax=Dissulfuribacter thermophilus TaxID=1156395 RepID=A0A1B9F9H7_9BACT|nr:hypothetical protein [Dissulfuribacter thermophilus]OCC16567.1 hypothetical protein DBT_0385 [Dissulfuribacter thermophilus]